MFRRLGNFVVEHWIMVLILWCIVTAVLVAVCPRWDDVTRDGDLAYLPADSPSVLGERLLADAFPERQGKSDLVFVFARDSELSDEDLDLSTALAARFQRETEPDIPTLEIWTYETPIIGEQLISKDEKSVLVVLSLKNEFMAVGNIAALARTRQIVDDFRGQLPAGLKLGITGSAAVGGDMLTAAKQSIDRTELATIALVVIILLAVYRAPLVAMVPLVAIGVSVVVATHLVAAVTQMPGIDFKIFKTTKIFVVVVLFGCGTDFCLFLIARFREELRRGRSLADALAEAQAQVGGALTASALTTVLGLAMMGFADYGKFRYSGPAIGLCLLVALAASTTLAPALLRLLGRAVFWPMRVDDLATAAAPTESAAESMPPRGDVSPKSSHAIGPRGIWFWVADKVLARPGMILIVAFVLMSPLAWLGTKARASFDLLEDLSPHRTSRVGTALLERHFEAGQAGPITVLAVQPGTRFDDADDPDAETKVDIAERRRGGRKITWLTRQLYMFPSVTSVRSRAEPLGDPPTGKHIGDLLRGEAGIRNLSASESARVKASYVSHTRDYPADCTRFEIVLDAPPFHPHSVAALDEIEAELRRIQTDPDSPWQGATFFVAGTTAGIRDLERVIEGDKLRIQMLVTAAVLAVLLVLVRKPLVCVYLVATVVLGYFVTLGISDWLFRTIAEWQGIAYVGLDWKVSVYLFVILVAVGEDYNIYLVTRVVEEQAQLGYLQGLRAAMIETGGVISSCGVIMAGTFLAMLSGTLQSMHQLGFALALGVLLDTFFIRPVLVPCFLALLARRAAPSTR